MFTPKWIRRYLAVLATSTAAVMPLHAGAATANFEILKPSEEIQITKPRYSLVRGNDGAFYGIGTAGGVADRGGLFRITADGEYRDIASFTGTQPGGLPGAFPTTKLTPASDGRLYGTTTSGNLEASAFYVTPGDKASATHMGRFTELGIPNSSASEFLEAPDGRLYGLTSSKVLRLTPGASPTLESVASFANDSAGTSLIPDKLALGPDGKLYGALLAGTNNGIVIAVTPGDTVTVEQIGRFTNTSSSLPGRMPNGKLLPAPDGRLYGVTTAGGSSGLGVIFVVKPGTPSTVETVAHFTGTTGALPGSTPLAALTLGSDGRIYGMTSGGGEFGAGTIFRINIGTSPSAELVTSFLGAATGSGLRGGSPQGGWVAHPDGKLYGISSRTAPGDAGVSTVYRLTPGDTATVEHLADFDGVTQGSSLTLGESGKIYGVAYVGNGYVYVIDPSSPDIVQILRPFVYPQREFRNVRLARGKDGAFYGFNAEGMLFRVGADGTYQELEKAPLDDVPNMPMTLANDGRFYATAEDDDTYGSVIVVDLDSTPRIRRLVSFSGNPRTGIGDAIPGREPRSPLTEAPDGRLYGVTSGGAGVGTVFIVTPGDQPSVTHIGELFGNNIYGFRADKALTLAGDGRLYSTTYQGGRSDFGTVFRVTPGASPTIQLLASFTGQSGTLPGASSYAKLYAAPDGYLYGATTGGGEAFRGTLFRIKPGNQAVIQSIASFTGLDGALPGIKPWEAPTPASDGYYYGATGGEGSIYSTIYRLTPGEQPVVEHVAKFTGVGGDLPGSRIMDPLVEGGDGKIYGAAIEGGTFNHGVLFRFSPRPEPGFETLVHFGSGVTGIDPDSHLLRLPNGTFYGTTNSSIFRVRFDTPPVLLNLGQPQTTLSSASIAADVYPSESMTDVRLEYGRSDQFGDVQSFEDIGSGTLEKRLNFSISGLQPHNTYYYRVVAENGFGTVRSETRSFNTGNLLPHAANDSILSNGQAVTANVGANDTDADGDALAISQITQPAFGTVTWEGSTITYTPGPGYLGRDLFTYTISDGFGGSDTAEVHVYSDRTLSRSLLQTGITFTGLAGPLKSFDGFAFSGEEGNAFIGLARVGSGKRQQQAVIGVEPAEVLLSTGAEVTGLADVFLGKFRSLVGKALLADFKRGKGVSAKNDTAILVLEEEGLRLVAREGDDVIGIPEARFAAFTSLDWGRGAVFTAKVKGTGITPQNDNGIWAETASGLRLVCRERDDILVNGEERRVKSIAALLASTNSQSLASGCAQNGLLLFRVTFTDKTQAVLRFDCKHPDSGLTVLAATGDSVPDLTGATYVDFGLPVCAADGSVAFRATANVTAGSTPGNIPGIVLDGAFHTTPNGASATIVPTSDPVVGPDGQAAVMVNLLGGKPRKIGAVASVNENGLEVLAGVGDEPPGVEGAKLQRFAQLDILPERGAIFAGLLAQKKGGVNAKNRNGIWAQNAEGELILVLQAGSSLSVDGTEQQVQSFQLLPAGRGAGSQALGEDGSFVCLVKFKGGAQRVMQFRVP